MTILCRILLILLVPFGAAFSASSGRLLAIMPTGEKFLKVLDGIRSELGSPYSIEVVDVNKDRDAVAALLEKCSHDSLAGMILMDSKALSLYRKIEKSHKAIAALPKFILMTLQAETASRGIKNSTGIRFEVPAFTVLTNFRTLSLKDVKTVAVFHRAIYKEDIENNQRLLAKEMIDLVPICLDCDRNGSITIPDAIAKMQKAYKNTAAPAKIDVYLIMTDNLVVNEKSLGTFWLGTVKKGKKPMVGMIETLSSPKIGAAVFTADPDYSQLGVQAAEKIIQVLEEGVSPENSGFEPLISVKTVLNLEIAKAIGWKIREDRIHTTNKVIK